MNVPASLHACPKFHAIHSSSDQGSRMPTASDTAITRPVSFLPATFAQTTQNTAASTVPAASRTNVPIRLK